MTRNSNKQGDPDQSSKKPRPEKPVKPEFRFTKVGLTDAEKAEIKAAPMDGTQLMEWLLLMTRERWYKVGFSYVPKDDCFVVAVTATDDTADDCNRCLTSRSNSLDVTITLAAYKIDVYCIDGLPDPDGEAGRTEIME